MIVDAVRFVADRLSDPTTGVNALLASVPRPAGDAAPPAVTLYHEMDDALVALGPADALLNADGPALLVSSLSVQRDAVQVCVRYAAPQADAQTFARDGWHTLRAATRAVRTAPAGASSARGRIALHGVTLGPVTEVTPFPPPPSAATEAFAPAIVVVVPAFDTWVAAVATPA